MIRSERHTPSDVKTLVCDEQFAATHVPLLNTSLLAFEHERHELGPEPLQLARLKSHD